MVFGRAFRMVQELKQIWTHVQQDNHEFSAAQRSCFLVLEAACGQVGQFPGDRLVPGHNLAQRVRVVDQQHRVGLGP
eukprot:6987566-Heterocapsa_arctica.AAC.1